MSDPFPVFITKYCLSAGIEQASAYSHPVSEEAVIVADGRFKGFTLRGDDWHRTEKDARTWAERLRRRVIEQDKKRLAELEALNFTTTGEEG